MPAVAVASLATPQSSPTAQRIASKPHVLVRDTVSGQRRVFVQPNADIDECIGFSVKRWIFSIIGLILVLTDIPRTGFAIRLRDFYPYIGAGAVMYWGPYSYHVYHMNVSRGIEGEPPLFTATSGGVPVEAIDLWSYKFDTLSIPTRAVAQHLSIMAYPPCVLYRMGTACPDSHLSIPTAFGMIDAVVQGIQDRYFSRDGEQRPVTLIIQSNWIDRLHHIVAKPFWQHREDRWLSIHHYRVNPRQTTNTTGLPLCQARDAQKRFRLHQWALTAASVGRPTLPVFCELEIAWPCDHPIDGPTHQLPIDQHISARLVMFQSQYPKLRLDLTIFSTRLRMAPRTLKAVPRISIHTDNLEIVTLIRGQMCPTSTSANCTTVFVDDYRYERAHCVSDEDEWLHVTRVLRAAAQGYVWLRVVLLAVGCYWARAREPKFHGARRRRVAQAAAATFFRIPGYTVVYGSWFPLLLYSIAHSIDGVTIHLIGEYVWASINGTFQFDLLAFALVATVQMRNIWMIALAWRILGEFYTRVIDPRQHPWHPEEGLKSVRGTLISLTSWLTIFSYMRTLSFRDTRVIEVIEHSRDRAHLNEANTIQPIESGIGLDLKATGLAFSALATTLLLLQGLLRWRFREPINFFTCQSYFVPLSAGVLWPRSMLGVFWNVTWSRGHRGAVDGVLGSLSSFQSLRNVVALLVGEDKKARVRRSSTAQRRSVLQAECPWCRRPPWYLSWVAVHGCRTHERVAHVDRRPREIWALVRLMNITFMSDPLVLLRLYGLGRPLYLYRVITPRREGNADADADRHRRHDNRRHHHGTLLLPREIDRETPHLTDATDGTTLELLGIIDSSAMPWHALVDVG